MGRLTDYFCLVIITFAATNRVLYRVFERAFFLLFFARPMGDVVTDRMLQSFKPTGC